MTSRITQLIDDEGAVSPVIGVILMVAITVILAAVIGTFVLGLGGQVSQTAPQASISIAEVDKSGDAITLKHGGSDTLKAQETEIKLTETDTGGAETSFTATADGQGDWSTAGTIIITTDGGTDVVTGGSSDWSTPAWASGGTSFTLDDGDEVDITFIDQPSGQIIADKSLTV